MPGINWTEMSLAASIKIGDGSTGTGFVLQAKPNLYLVTAGHVLMNSKNNNLYSEYIELHQPAGDPRNNLFNIIQIDLNKASYAYDDVKDIFVIKIGTKVGDRRKLADGVTAVQNQGKASVITKYKALEELNVADDIFVIGYPSSIGIQKDRQFDYRKPLLQKGIVSNIYEEEGTIIIDLFAYPGQSGSPVVMRENSRLVSIGFITRSIPYEQSWYNF